MDDGQNLGRQGVSVGTRRLSARPQYKGAVMVQIGIDYPQLAPGQGGGAAGINAFYRDEARRFFRYAEETLFRGASADYLECFRRHAPFRAAEVAQSFRVPYASFPFLSVVTQRRVVPSEGNAGAERENAAEEAATWHLPSGNRLALQDFFYEPSYKALLYRTVASALNVRMKQEKQARPEAENAKAVFRGLDETRFYLTGTGFALFFPAGAFGSASPSVFEVPYASFGANLRPGFPAAGRGRNTPFPERAPIG